MTPFLIIQRLSVISMVLEVLHRVLLAIMNAIRLMLSEEYREEIFGKSEEVAQA